MIQILANSLIAGSSYALVALGFSLIYGVTRFFHFTHGVLYTLGAYAVFAASSMLGLSMGAAVVLGLLVTSVTGMILEWGIYRPIRSRKAGGLVQLIASLGLYTILQNVISMGFGDDPIDLRNVPVARGLSVLGARITPSQLAIIGASLTSFVLVLLVLRYTRFGKAFRAVACDPDLAQIRGIDTDRTILGAFAVGSGLAGLAGILSALDVNMTPTMGLSALMMGIIAMIIGGTRSLAGIALGGCCWAWHRT